MPIALRYIAYALPQTFACEAMRGILLRGWYLITQPAVYEITQPPLFVYRLGYYIYACMERFYCYSCLDYCYLCHIQKTCDERIMKISTDFYYEIFRPYVLYTKVVFI